MDLQPNTSPGLKSCTGRKRCCGLGIKPAEITPWAGDRTGLHYHSATKLAAATELLISVTYHPSVEFTEKYFQNVGVLFFFFFFFKRMCSSGCIFKINARLPRLLNIETCWLLKSVTFWGKLQGLRTQRAQSGGENQAEYSTLVFMTASEHVHQICSIKPIKNLMTNQIMQDF